MNYYGGSDIMESGELHVLRYIADEIKNEPQPVVFDVGANNGQYLQQALQILPDQTNIYCFEPSTVAFENLKKIAFGHNNVMLQKSGIGESREKMILRYPVSGSVLASLHVFNNFTEMKSEEIEIVTIDAFCAENNIRCIHYLKMDIEGHEVAALKGATDMITAGKVKMIQFEFGQPNIASRTYLKDFYQALGGKYDICRVVRNGFVELGKYSEENEVFLTTNYLAILKPAK